jgi:hypothetical protein
MLDCICGTLPSSGHLSAFAERIPSAGSSGLAPEPESAAVVVVDVYTSRGTRSVEEVDTHGQASERPQHLSVRV